MTVPQVLTVVGEVCVEILGGSEARPNLLQLTCLGSKIPLVYMFGHILGTNFNQIIIYRNIISIISYRQVYLPKRVTPLETTMSP